MKMRHTEYSSGGCGEVCVGGGGGGRHIIYNNLITEHHTNTHDVLYMCQN
jgi:hypothetical protein